MQATELQSIPYFSGTSIACPRMLLVFLGFIDSKVTEEEIAHRAGLGGLSETAREERVATPEGMLGVFESYAVPAKLQTEGRVSLIEEKLSRGHGIVAFLGARALKGVFDRQSVSPDALKPVVVTGARSGRVYFHDPYRPDGENQSVRRGIHSWFLRTQMNPFNLQRRTFESMWGGGLNSQFFEVMGSYLTLKMPDVDVKSRFTRRYVYIETFPPNSVVSHGRR